MRLSISIIATYATLDEARQARVELSTIYDNLAIKHDCDTFKLIRYEVNSPFDALDTIVENSPSHYRNSAQSRKRKRSKSDVEQFEFE